MGADSWLSIIFISPLLAHPSGGATLVRTHPQRAEGCQVGSGEWRRPDGLGFPSLLVIGSPAPRSISPKNGSVRPMLSLETWSKGLILRARPWGSGENTQEPPFKTLLRHYLPVKTCTSHFSSLPTLRGCLVGNDSGF